MVLFALDDYFHEDLNEGVTVSLESNTLKKVVTKDPKICPLLTHKESTPIVVNNLLGYCVLVGKLLGFST